MPRLKRRHKARFVTPYIRRAAIDRRPHIQAAASWVELVYKGLRRLGAVITRRYANQMRIEIKGKVYRGKLDHGYHGMTITRRGNARPTVIIRSLQEAVDFYQSPYL